MISEYISLTKPRMVMGNLLVALAGFLFVGPPILPWLLLLMLVGLGLVMASGCAFNNVYDRGIDAKMERTKNRALPAGTVSVRGAFTFASVVLFAGLATLYFTNTLTLIVAVVGFVSYVLLYTPLKHVTGHALWIGAISGATPPVVGYAASAGMLDYKALLLFALLFAWQIPHFISIALYRFDEYKAAGVPLIIKVGPKTDLARQRARKVFHASLIVLLLFCMALPVIGFFPF